LAGKLVAAKHDGNASDFSCIAFHFKQIWSVRNAPKSKRN
jgi:hypothetical protein